MFRCFGGMLICVILLVRAASRTGIHEKPCHAAGILLHAGFQATTIIHIQPYLVGKAITKTRRSVIVRTELRLQHVSTFFLWLTLLHAPPRPPLYDWATPVRLDTRRHHFSIKKPTANLQLVWPWSFVEAHPPLLCLSEQQPLTQFDTVPVSFKTCQSTFAVRVGNRKKQLATSGVV